MSTVGALTLGLLLTEAVMLILVMSADSYPRWAFGGITLSFCLFAGAILGPLGALAGCVSKVPGALCWGLFLTGVNTLPLAAMFMVAHSMGL